MSEKTKKENNFFKDLIKSIKDLDKYEDFAIEAPSRGIKYFLKLTLLFVLIFTIFFTYKCTTNTKKIYGKLKDVLPDFSYSNGIFETDLEENVVINDYEGIGGKIVFDINADEEKIKEYEKDSSIYLLFLKDKFILKDSAQMSWKYTEFLSAYQVDKFTKQSAIEYFDNLNVVPLVSSIYIVGFVLNFFVYLYIIIKDILFLIIFVFFVSILSRVKISFAPAFNIAVHSITLSTLLYLAYLGINLLTGFEIRYFSIMYYTISFIYIVVAILMIKTDLINRQIELTKIIQEQEKIRQEKQQEEEQQEEKPKDEEKNNKDEKKKKKEKEEEPKDLGTDTPA